MGGCPYCFGSGKVVVWKEVDRNEELVTIQSRLETCSKCNGSGFGKIETKELYTESDVKNAFDDGYRAGLEAAQPKWISVDKRKPKSREFVLLQYAKDAQNPTMYARNTMAVGRYEYGMFLVEGCSVKVTHWMPLPEPPKEEV